MKLIIAGLGPSENLLTVKALTEAKAADVVLLPRSSKGSIAEKLIKNYIDDKKIIIINFPMISDAHARDEIISAQLEAKRGELDVERIFFPVIGDSMLYSTAKYLIDALTKIFPDINLEFIPGVSAHSLAASCAKKFLAMGDEILAVIPGTANPDKIKQALKFCDCAAIYKPTALKDKNITDGFSKIIRVDYAGFPELETITEGKEALENINEYISIILLWKN